MITMDCGDDLLTSGVIPIMVKVNVKGRERKGREGKGRERIGLIGTVSEYFILLDFINEHVVDMVNNPYIKYINK